MKPDYYAAPFSLSNQHIFTKFGIPQKRISASPHEPKPLSASTEFYQIVIKSLSNLYNFFPGDAYSCVQRTGLMATIRKAFFEYNIS